MKTKTKRGAAPADGAQNNDSFLPLSLDQPAATSVTRRNVGQGEPSTSGSNSASRVVYIGHLPHGFYEKQLLGFFSQFGKLTRVRLSRNKKSGKAKHYAFLEFQYPEVARIAAEAMDGYFMFAQKLTCKVMKPEDVHPQLFAGANRKFKNIPWSKLERQRHDRERTPEEHAQRIARLLKKDRVRQQRIAAAGIDYEYPSLAATLPVKPKKTTFQ